MKSRGWSRLVIVITAFWLLFVFGFLGYFELGDRNFNLRLDRFVAVAFLPIVMLWLLFAAIVWIRAEFKAEDEVLLQRTRAITAPNAATVTPTNTSAPQIRPWVRFWARSFDVSLFSIAFAFLL